MSLPFAKLMPGLRLCDGDPLLSTLRDVFDATPLRVPDGRVAPLAVVALSERRSRLLGPVGPLLETTPTSFPSLAETEVASMTGKRSRTVKLKLGLSILEGFLPALGVSLPAVEVAFSNATQVSFRFDRVQRRFIEVTQLGKVLSGNALARGNPVTTMFLEQRSELLVIDSVLVSPGFAVTAEELRSAATSTELPVSTLPTSVNADVTVSRVNERTISFDGSASLTFAFSCVRFFVDEHGVLSSIEPHKGPPALGFSGPELVLETPNRVLLTAGAELHEWG
jgi:hypothetical protein